jgi:hypothetical protein
MFLFYFAKMCIFGILRNKLQISDFKFAKYNIEKEQSFNFIMIFCNNKAANSNINKRTQFQNYCWK